jgi:L-serine dehydratase
MAFINSPQCFLSPVEMKMIAYGLATLEENSRMKRIVACPTAGGSGSVPAALVAVEEEHGIAPEQTLKGLITAGLIGEITARRMFLSGSAAGCQAEVGVASGMAAAGLVEMLGGSAEQVLNAAAISMQNLMGLVCDPVAGLVEVPCVVRNGLSGVQAAASATMALAGVKSFIPMDEVVEAMAAVGKLMHPSLKETAEGGLAQTPSAKRFTERFKAAQTINEPG